MICTVKTVDRIPIFRIFSRTLKSVVLKSFNLVSSNISLGSKLQNDLSDEKHMGNTVVTTFDARLQEIAYNAMGIYSGAVIVSEPSTGRILAMVSKPDFDPNKISDIWDDILADTTSSVLLNRVTQGFTIIGNHSSDHCDLNRSHLRRTLSDHSLEHGAVAIRDLVGDAADIGWKSDGQIIVKYSASDNSHHGGRRKRRRVRCADGEKDFRSVLW